MTQIDFYILKKQLATAQLPFVCRLLDKAYQQGNQVYIYTEGEKQAQQLSDLVWTFSDISFVPHALVGQPQATCAPILIGEKNIPEQCNDILINLTSQPIGIFNQFRRLLEIVPEEEPWRQQGRGKYAFYRDQHCTPKTHEISI